MKKSTKIQAQKNQTENNVVLYIVAENLVAAVTLDDIETSMLIEDLAKSLPATNHYRKALEDLFGI